MPAMLADMIKHLVAPESDLAVIGRLADGERSLPAALAVKTDVLVLQRGTLSGGPDKALAEMLVAQPLALLVVGDDGKSVISTKSHLRRSGWTPSPMLSSARCALPRAWKYGEPGQGMAITFAIRSLGNTPPPFSATALRRTALARQ